MITRLLVGVARSLFIVAVCFLAIAVLALYGAYRVLRSAFARSPSMPLRDATFNLLATAIVLARTVQAMKPPAPEAEPMEETFDDVPFM